MEVTGNGEEAVEFLNEHRNDLPCIILLDINMPRMNGIEFLRIIKQDDCLKMIRVQYKKVTPIKQPAASL